MTDTYVANQVSTHSPQLSGDAGSAGWHEAGLLARGTVLSSGVSVMKDGLATVNVNGNYRS